MHLTPILAELAGGRQVVDQLVKLLHRGMFRMHEWAFTPGLSARDLITSVMMSLILAIYTGNTARAFIWTKNRGLSIASSEII